MNGLTRFANGSLAQFGVIAGGIIALCLLGVGLSALGLPQNLIAYLFVFCGFAVIAVCCRHNKPNSVAASGVAVSVEWLSAFGLFGIVGAVYSFGHDGLAILLGLAAGFVVSLLVVAPRLSIIPAASLPDFLQLRFDSEALRYTSLGVLSVVTMLFLAAQLTAAGLIAVHIFQIPSVVGTAVGAALVIVLAISARRGTIGSAQVIMAIVAIAALALAGFWLFALKTGIVVPQLAAGGLFVDISSAEVRLGLEREFGAPFKGWGLLNSLILIVVLGAGSAVMPHLISRVVSPEEPAETQQALRRGLILFVAIATILPGLAVLARADVLSLFVSAKNSVPASAFSDALLEPLANVSATLSADQMIIPAQSVLMAVPELSGASGWMIGLFALFGLAVSAVAGASAVFALSEAISSRTSSIDVIGERGLTIAIVTVVAALLSVATGLSVLCFGAWAYSLIASAVFAPLVLGLWWRRATGAGAIAGMLGGFTVTALLILGTSLGSDTVISMIGEARWLGTTHLIAGMFGVVLSFILMVAVSMLGNEPPLNQLDIMDRLDAPPVKVSPEALE